MKRSRLTVPIASALLAAALSPVAFAQENYATAWSGHTNVVINSQLAGTMGSVVRFPLLVRLDSTHAAIFTQAKAGGADVRFTKANNVTRLHHQIESWNATTRQAVIWVLADTIPAARSNYALRMHWGNAAAVDSSNGARVFDTANHFQAVWHMAGTANETDATLNGFTAAQNGTPASAPAVVGAGRVVSGGNYFRATGTASGKLNFPEGSNYTISAWVFTTTMPGHGTILSKHDNAYALKLNADAANWEFFEYGTDLTAAGWNWVNAPTFNDLGAWRLLTAVRSEFDIALYVNGVRMDNGFSTASSTAARVLTRDVVIGAQPAGSNTAVQRPFDGTLDEVRMSNVSRSGDWIKLDYETQKHGSTVVRLMDTVPAALAPGAGARATFSVKASGKGLSFQVNDAEAFVTRARVTILDMRGLTISNRVTLLQGGALAWDGRSVGGQYAPQGVYAVRISLLDARGGVVRTLEKKVPLMR